MKNFLDVYFARKMDSILKVLKDIYAMTVTQNLKKVTQRQ
jgi:hypothetical protein